MLASMGYVYILASKPHGTLYVGVTRDLVKRVHEHKMHVVKGFTQRYGVDSLMYFEQFEDIDAAITREKRLKKYKRDWKVALIEESNPHWTDLYLTLAVL